MGSVVVAPGLWSTGSMVKTHRLCCSMACGIFLHQVFNPCLLHWQMDSLSLSHQGSPIVSSLFNLKVLFQVWCEEGIKFIFPFGRLAVPHYLMSNPSFSLTFSTISTFIKFPCRFLILDFLFEPISLSILVH